MSGPFPRLDGLVDLEYLSLDSCGVTGDLPSLSNLPKLTDVDIDNNWLTGPIDEMRKLTAVTYLDFEYNSFTGPITPLLGLQNVVKVYIGNNLLTSDSEVEQNWVANKQGVSTTNCFVDGAKQFGQYQGGPQCPQNIAASKAKTLKPCADSCLSKIQGWEQFSPSGGGALVPGNFKAVCNGWDRLEWNKFLGCTGCPVDEQMEAEAFVTVLANTCQEYSGKPVQPVTFQSSQPTNHRGQDYVAQTIAYVDNLVTLTVIKNGQTHVCFRDCIPLIPNYNAMIAATTTAGAIQEFTNMCTGPLNMKPYLDCMMPIAVDGLNYNSPCSETYTDGGRAFELIAVLKTVCPPYCTSTRLDDCFSGSAAPYKYIESRSCASSPPAGYHCYNSLTPPIPICNMQFCSNPENCYCSGESQCVGTPSHPNGKCAIPPKTVAVVQGTKFYAGEDIAIDANSNAWDLNSQTMTIVSISLSDGTTTLLLDKDTCWGTQLNRNAADSKTRYSFKLPSTAVAAGVKSFADLRPAATGQRCSGPASLGLGLGIALPNPATVYTGTVTVQYSALSKRRAADAFSEGQAVFSFSLDAKATTTTSSTNTRATTSTTTVSTTTSTTPLTTSNASTTSDASTTSSLVFEKTKTVTSANPTASSLSSLKSSETTTSTAVTSSASPTTIAETTTKTTTTTVQKGPDFIINVGFNGGVAPQKEGGFIINAGIDGNSGGVIGGAGQGNSIVIGGGNGAINGVGSSGENGIGSSVVVEGKGQLPTVDTGGGGGNLDVGVGGNASGSTSTGLASGVAPSSGTAVAFSGNSGSRPISTQVKQGEKPVVVAVEASTRKFLIGSSATMNKKMGAFAAVSSLVLLF
ncbi:hypothetical protein BDR26DRAFT_901431 [Obelidium mucronatum]|nr:hypothetical protein BDR26DRAFT_901431 [Obelidium mucronatum]